jgi:hypothetical protein
VNFIKDGAWALAVGISVALFVAPLASAQESSLDTYGGDGADLAAQVAQGGGGGSATDTGAAGALPFTGMDVLLAAGGGFVLLLAGLALARVLQPQSVA